MSRSRLLSSKEVVEEEVDTGPEEIVPCVARALRPLVRRILCTNPGVRTGLGTNTYLVGIDEIVVIDPGPENDDQLDSICGGDRIKFIICTSGDPEHSGNVEKLKARTGATVLGLAKSTYGGIDEVLAHKGEIGGAEFRLTIRSTPGPSADHLTLYLTEERMLFAGDLIAEGMSVAVIPPAGDMAAYLDSLAEARKMRLKRIVPAHGTSSNRRSRPSTTTSLTGASAKRRFSTPSPRASPRSLTSQLRSMEIWLMTNSSSWPRAPCMPTS